MKKFEVLNIIKVKKSYKLFSFFITFLFLFVISMICNQTEWYYDSSQYWYEGQQMKANGSFHLLDFPQSIRGFVFPFILLCTEELGTQLFHNPYLIFRIYQSFMIALLIAIIIPYIIEIEIKSKRYIIGCFCSVILFSFFLNDLLLFPLSDISALTLYTLSICLLKKDIREENNRLRVIQLFFAGILLYATYNCRTGYLFPILLEVFIWLIITIKKDKKNIKKIVIKCVSLILGIYIIAFPQMKINYKYFQTYSPQVQTAWNFGEDLTMWQLKQGITIDRYETFIGSIEEYPNAGVVYRNIIGEKIISSEKIDTIIDYIKTALKYPLEFIGIYVKGTLSNMTPLYGQIYIENLSKDKSLRFLINAMCFFCLGYSFVIEKPEKMQKYKRNIIGIFLLFFPSILTIPSAGETRFFLSIYIFLYTYLGYWLDWKILLQNYKKHYVLSTLALLFLLCIWSTIIGGILANGQKAIFDFGKEFILT